MYKILHDYGMGDFRFYEEEFYTAKDAVAKAIELNYSSPFMIVKIIKWEAKEI